jgi:hypothetical protein
MGDEKRPTPPTGTPTGAGERMNTADPASPSTRERVRKSGATANPDAKVPSDLYPDPPGVTDSTKGGPDD